MESSIKTSDKKFTKSGELIHRARYKTDTHFDRIYNYFFTKDEIELSEIELKIAERWEYVWKLLGNYHTKPAIVNRIRKKFDIARSTAWEDIKMAQLLFSDPTEQLDEAKRAISAEWILKALKGAMKEKHYLSAERLIALYNKLYGLDKNSEANLGEIIKKLKPHTIIITGDPKSLEQEANDLMADIEDAEIVE